MVIVGIAGKAGSGKDSIAKWFGRYHDAFVTSFADPIKQTLIGMFPGQLTWKHFTDRELKEAVIPSIGASPRRLAQLLGTEFGRAVHPDFWVHRMAEYLKTTWPNGFDGVVAIPDVRFENEAKWVRENGVLIHVERPGIAPVASHASEAGVVIEEGDYRIVNDRELTDLEFTLMQTFPNRVPILRRAA